MRNANILRWILVVIMLAVLTTVLSSPALAEVAPLPLDQLIPGNPAQTDGWTMTDAKTVGGDVMILKYTSKTREWAPTDSAASPSSYLYSSKVKEMPSRYEDASLTMEISYLTARPSYKAVNVPCLIVRIKIADPSQLRTAMSYDSYDKGGMAKAEDIAKHVNAIVAVNGDFFKYHQNVGYVVRQGEFYRDKLNGKRDLLLIDQNGDFHAVPAATSENAAACIDGLEQSGLTVVNSFTLGPVLVADGEAQIMSETCTAKNSEFQWRYPQQRVAICQLGELEYAIVEAYGKTDSTAGMTLQEFADFIAYQFPECRLAYNLDGGGSTNVVVNGVKIHKTPGNRQISDILYFASAYTDGASEE